jgi:hypothetical protein
MNVRKRRPEGGKALLAGLLGVFPVLLLAASGALDAAAAGGAVCTSQTRSASHGGSYAITVGDDDDLDFAWALVKPDGANRRETFGTTDTRASQLIDQELRVQRGRFLYARVDGRDWVIRDPALLSHADDIVQPMAELGRMMGELGSRQGALGAQQGRLGGEQGRLGARQGQIAAKRAQLQVRAAVNDDDQDAELRDLQRSLDDESRSLGREMERLGRQQAELGQRQAALGREQARYGQQMKKVNQETSDQILRLVRDAVRDGRAKQVGEVSESSL